MVGFSLMASNNVIDCHAVCSMYIYTPPEFEISNPTWLSKNYQLQHLQKHITKGLGVLAVL